MNYFKAWMVSQKVLWSHLTANKNYDEENELKRSKKVKIKGRKKLAELLRGQTNVMPKTDTTEKKICFAKTLNYVIFSLVYFN